MRRFIAIFTVLLLCIAAVSSLASIPELNLSEMSASDLKQLKKDIEAEIKLHHEINSDTQTGVKKAAEGLTEELYRQQGISISWAWHGWEYEYTRDKDFFTYASHLDYKDSEGKNHQVKVAADLIWNGKEYKVYHLYLDKQLVLSDESGIPSEHLIDTSKMVINKKTETNLSLLKAEELKELEKRVNKELDDNHNARNSGRVNDVLKKTVEDMYAAKGINKVEWPWFDYDYTCDWNCYTEKTRITYEENGKKNKDIPVYAELFPEGDSYTVCYLKIGDNVVINDLAEVDSQEGQLFLNSRKYEKANELMNDGQFRQAAELFDELGAFDNSVQMKAKCLDADHQASYDEANRLADEGQLEEAAGIFDSLGDFSDSREAAEKCREKIRENNYNAANDLMKNGQYEQAEASFAALTGYQDSDEKAEECREAIRKRQYDTAVARMSEGDYAGAIALFTPLGEYLDSGDKIAECQNHINQQTYEEAESLLAAGEYAEASEKFELLGDFGDSTDRAITVRGIVSSLDREIIFSETEYHLYPKETTALIPEIKKITDSATDDTVLVYTSSDPTVAKVDASGLVSAGTFGTAVIHCATADNEYIGADVTVYVEKNVNKVTMSENKLDLAIPGVRSESQLSVIIDPSDAYVQTGVWFSSNESVATVDQEGRVTAVSAGKAVISFVSDDSGKTKKEAKCNVNVVQAVTSISLKETPDTVYVGKTVALKAELQPMNAANKKVEWSSNNVNIATVSPTGQVKGVSPGAAVITAKSADGPSVSYYATVKIAPVTLKVTGKAKCIAKNHVGNSWGKQMVLNGEAFKGTGKVKVENGDIITVGWEIWENDSNPDWGDYTEKIEITPEIMKKGITLTGTVYVTENGGRYSGNSAEWSVSITIRP